MHTIAWYLAHARTYTTTHTTIADRGIWVHWNNAVKVRMVCALGASECESVVLSLAFFPPHEIDSDLFVSHCLHDLSLCNLHFPPRREPRIQAKE